MARRQYRTSLARLVDNDWKGIIEGMDDKEIKPTHSTRKINDVEIGERRSGIVRYMLCNKKGESLKLEILHLLHNEEFVLKKERRIEALDDGYGLLHKWREKGIVKSEGDIADVRIDMLFQGEIIRI